MNPNDFTFLQKLLYDQSGLALTEDKTYLLESRLTPIAKANDLADIAALTAKIRTQPNGSLAREVIDSMTTNESMFFRDNKPFDQFKQVVLPALLESNANTKSIRIWSAACSNGQEPYSLAMLLKEEAAKLLGWRIEIIATDLCRSVIEKAKEGSYSQFEVQRGLPITMLVKYFQQEGNQWKIKPEIRDMVRFEERNLMDNYAALGKFDIILCRNVLIYFDEKTKTDVLRRMHQSLNPDGFLYLGSTETAFTVTDVLTGVANHRGLYQPNKK